VAKRTPLPCNEVNCGGLLPKCGTANTYSKLKCRCDACAGAKSLETKKYREENREAYLARRRAYRQKNGDKVRAGQRRHYRKNREASIERSKKNYLENREAILEYHRRYDADNRDAKRDYDQKRYLENREEFLSKARRWAEENPDRARANKRLGKLRRRTKELASGNVPFTAAQLEQRIAYYGNRCYLQLPNLCTNEVEHIDHVKPVAKYGPTMLANLRPACQPCNQRKGDKWPFNV
jgi:5-methylcytosine-specific restriction endonuclease McrA